MRGSGIQVFIGVKITRNPEGLMVTGQVKLGQFIGNNEIFQIGLKGKFIPESHAVFKYPEYNIEQETGCMFRLQMDRQFFIMIADILCFTPDSLPGLIK